MPGLGADEVAADEIPDISGSGGELDTGIGGGFAEFELVPCELAACASVWARTGAAVKSAPANRTAKITLPGSEIFPRFFNKMLAPNQA